MEDLGKVHDISKVRLRVSTLPFGNRCQRDAEPLRKLFLSESQALPKFTDILSQVVFHLSPPAVFRPVLVLLVSLAFVVSIGIAKSIRVTSLADVQADRLFHGHYMQSPNPIEHPIGVICQLIIQRCVEFLVI